MIRLFVLVALLAIGVLMNASSANAESTFEHLLIACKAERAALDAEIKREGTETLEKLIRAYQKSRDFGSPSGKCFDRKLKALIDSRPPKGG